MAIRFGDFELDEKRFQLRLGGRRLAIRPKVFDLLVLLVRFRDRVVIREELVLALWGTTAVGPGSLSGLVNELRQVLGENGVDSSSIRTVHARGYQFVAVVESSEVGDRVPTSQAGEPSPPITEARNQPSDPGLELIRSSFMRASSVGARAALLTGSTAGERARVGQWAERALGAAGFEVIRTTRPVEASGSAMVVVDRLLEALVEYRGLASLRSMIPMRSHELFERCSKQEGQQGLDSLAAQQYEGRILRGAAQLLISLAREQPSALLFDAGDLAPGEIVSALSPLLRLLGESRVFMLGTTNASLSKDESGRVLEQDDSRVDWIEGTRENRSNQPREDCNRLNAFLESCGVEALPGILAEALVAHVRTDDHALESLALWLSRESRTTDSQDLPGPAVRVGSSRMRRVEAGRSTLRPSIGTR